MSQYLEVPEHFKRQFSENWDLNVNQEISRLEEKVRVDNWKGREKVYKTLDDLEWQERTGRLTNSTPQEMKAANRRIVKRDFKCQVIRDRIDDDYLAELADPESELQEQMKRAWNREIDTLIALAPDQTEMGGAEPYNTSIDLPAEQKVAVDLGGSNEGLTPEKIEEAVEKLESYDIFANETELVLVIGPTEKRQLLQYVKSAPNSVWANMIGAWQEGKEKKLYDLNVVVSNRLQVASDVSTCFVFEKERGIIVVPDEMQTKFDVLPMKDHAVMLSCYAQYATLRRYEETVVTIACDRSA